MDIKKLSAVFEEADEKFFNENELKKLYAETLKDYTDESGLAKIEINEALGLLSAVVMSTNRDYLKFVLLKLFEPGEQ